MLLRELTLMQHTIDTLASLATEILNTREGIQLIPADLDG